MKAAPEEHKLESSGAAAFARRLAVVLCVFFAAAVNSHAQPGQAPEPPLPVDPRPLTQLIPDSEKALLAESSNPKKLVEAYLKISDTHLQAAFHAISANNHVAAERELDIYNKAVAAAGKEAFAVQDGKRSLSKRIEQILYKQIKTLETIERLFPEQREAFAEAALKHTKQLRVQALNEAFASGEVLKDPEAEKKPKSEPPLKDDQPVIREGAAMGQTPPHPSARAAPLQRAISFRRTAGFRRALPSAVSILPLIAAHFTSTLVMGQLPGDYLTDEEDEHVRVAQAPDDRAKVFMKIADRRLKAIAGPAPAPTDKKEQKKVEEEEREWGAVPKVSRTELLRHYARAISECMAKLEDAYERNPKSSVLPKALSVLRDATDKHLQTLRALKAEMTTEKEVAAISVAIYEAETANKGARDGLK